ncbi:regulator of G-protein signaling 22 [Sceloporus undulatus]|uniref:regulator of G-protein signaling 22 n=1 Tax=Sceloporus undulatus TaxID=8520 RepID=UPI001C4CB33F|nr:regulator of G-protein signaling 22 [Sceloporus undulatus]
MREKRLTTVPPCIRENEFEDFLATDDILVDFFNEFLSLPAFAETIKYNADFGIFEVASDAPEQIENQLKKLLYEQKPRNPIYDVTRPTKSESPVSKDLSRQPLAPPPAHLNIDLNYAAMCLDREQAITWIKKERLPAFLESDCYFEYRLAKLVSQVEWSRTGVNFVIDKKYYPWFRKMPPPPEAFEEDEDDVIMKKFYVSLGQATVTQTKDWFTLAKQREHMITTDSITHPVSSSHVRFSFEPSKMSSSNIDFRTKEMLPTASSILLNATVYSSGHAELESKLKKKQSPTGIPLLQQARARRSIDEGHSVSVPDTPSHTMLRAYVEQNWDSAPQEQMCDDLARYQELACFRTVDEFTLAYIQYILKNSVAVITGMPLKLNPTDVNFNRVSRVLVYEIEDSDSFMEPLLEHTPLLEDDTVERESEISTKSEKDNTETRAAWCISHKTYDIGNRHEFERFKGFIKGTLGERYWWLWVDIERLKALRDPKRQKRQLDRMKKIYLVSNGDYFLTSEVLQKLNLEDGDRWNLHNLRRIQSEVVKPLLLYWGPRFCVIHTAAIQTLNRKLKIWHSRQQKPRMDVDPFPQMVSLLPLRAKSCMPKIAHQREEISSAPPLSKGAVVDMYSQRPPRLLSAILPRSQSAVQEDPDGLVDLADISRQRPATACSNVTHLTVFPDKMDYLKPQLDRKYTYAEVIPGKTSPDISELGSSTMERMLQSLNTENRAGYVFTDFCEKSGNMVWKNSTYFWFDLQDYHQLFYQETLHPFKLCKQAQFLYANYIAPSANMDIGLQQATKNEIYSKIEPPFEDLFDSAEEYILTLLLVPWRKMVEQDKESYRKVELVEETRQLESVYFRKLQALHEKSISKKSEILAVEEDKVPERSDSTTVAERPAQILPEADKPYSIAELLQKRLDLEQFRIFLEQQSASVDLMCWIDIEQFRRMLHKNKAQREEKSKEIKNKYLNKKYFFGPDSPATKEEQEQIMKLGGGWGQILHEQVCPKILLEVQKSIQARLEKKWLPLYFSSEESGPKKKPKPHLEDAAEDILIQRFEKKIEPWKHVDNKWVSSSQEIITFRKALLNPITAFQFQRFVSLKGDLLENGVIFWQEVQKYKDMCHSHCDDAIIQKKITEIIRCFINSSIPPAIQIDIPEEQAQKIIEQRKELGPYVFREAQMTIFALLFKFWPKFCEFRSNLADENILPLLDKQREKTLEKMKKAKEAEEKVPRKRSAVSVKTGAATTMTTGLESRRTSKSELSSTPSFSGFGRQLSWNYSKYLEALQQERVLLKIQEDLEKKAVNSSAYAGVSSIFTFKSDLHPVPEKAVYPTPFTSAFVKQQRTHPPKDNERTPKL